MKKINLVSKIICFFVLVVSLCAGCEEAIPPTPTALPTNISIPTSTTVPTVTPKENAPPSTEWQLSSDGHIYYKESELYGGMFTINKEHPEWVEKYWEDTIRGLWNLNALSENSEFVNQFPTDDSLIDYLKNGNEPINYLAIPVIYPDGAKQYHGAATMETVEGAIDLSKIAIAIYQPTLEEIYHYSPDYVTGTKFIHFELAKGSVLVEQLLIGNANILKFTYRQDLLMDSTTLRYSTTKGDGVEFTVFALTDEKTNEENLLAATQLIRGFPLQMQSMVNPNFYSGRNSWKSGLNPPMLDIAFTGAIAEAYIKIITVDGGPLIVR